MDPFFSSIGSQNQGPGQGSSGLFSNPYVIVLLAGIVILLAGLLIVALIFLYRYIKQQRQSKPFTMNEKEEEHIDSQEKGDREKTIVLPTSSAQWEILGIEDKLILNILSDNQGNLLQKDLPNLTNYSKSTITRILTRLEEQQLIYRTPAGRGYRVFLQEKI